jgi:hypothetical protein
MSFVQLPLTFHRLENTRAVVEWISDNLPEEDEIKVDLQVGDVAEINQLFNDQCLGTFCDASEVFSSSLEPALAYY